MSLIISRSWVRPPQAAIIFFPGFFFFDFVHFGRFETVEKNLRIESFTWALGSFFPTHIAPFLSAEKKTQKKRFAELAVRI